MMKICLTDAGKRFNREWIFRHFNYEFIAGNSYAITGPNGSGKSTLLQVIAGAIAVSEGKIEYETALRQAQGDRSQTTAGQSLLTASRHPELVEGSTDTLYQHLSLAAPYLDVIEEMTATEFLRFHATFKSFLPSVTIEEIISIVGLEQAAHKQIRYYSSGMKQRVKLAQAIFSHVPCMLLDEPCTNLDSTGITLYQQLIADYCGDRLVIVSSNDEQEFSFCKERIDIMGYK